jgi:hypothetical protein
MQVVYMQAENIGMSLHTWRHQMTPRAIQWCVHLALCPMGSADVQKWCSLCNDFSPLLVLCVGCRVAVCVKTDDTQRGCLAWHESITLETFVYYCPYCGWSLQQRSPVCAI